MRTTYNSCFLSKLLYYMLFLIVLERIMNCSGLSLQTGENQQYMKENTVSSTYIALIYFHQRQHIIN